MSRLTLILLVIQFLLIPATFAQIGQGTPSPGPPETNVIVTGEYGLSLEIEGFEQRTMAGSYTPDRDIYLIMFGILHNDSSTSQCVYASNVRLIWNSRKYAPQNGPMGAVKETLDPVRDYIGAYLGQCLAANSNAPTFAVFDIPSKPGDVEIEFFGHAQTITPTWLEPISPSPTSTNTLAPTPELVIYYINSSSAVNIRSCAAISCDIVAVASPGDALQITNDSSDWYEVHLENGSTGYIAAFLVSRTKPVIQPQSVQPVIRPTSAPVQAATIPPQVQPTQPLAPVYTCNCSKTCGSMTCEEAYFQLEQCGCQRRDDDKDGVPCESICPGG